MKNQGFTPPPHKVDKIVLPLLKEEDLEIFRGKKIVIEGYDEGNRLLHKILKDRGFQVVAYTTEGWKHRYHKLDGIPKLFTKDVIKLARKVKNLLMIGSGHTAESQKKLSLFCNTHRITPFPHTLGHLLVSFGGKPTIDMLRDEKTYLTMYKNWLADCNNRKHFHLNRFYYRKPKNSVIICNPPKTADHTIDATFDKVNEIFQESLPKHALYHRLHEKSHRNVVSKVLSLLIAPYYHNGKQLDYVNIYHKSQFLNVKKAESKLGNVKVITSVREPIGQNISLLLQVYTTGLHYDSWIFGTMDCLPPSNLQETLNQFQTLFVDHPDDVIAMWNAYQKRYIYPHNNLPIKDAIPYSIQQFIPRFQNSVLDILAYPFDKEKGYTIIKEGNTEIFIYQLEKLNDLVPELSEWVGVPFDSLVMGNVGEDKWIGDAYKQAKKSLPITQEYFDRCFNEPYVKHCYSEADIEKFKEKWRSHIIQEDTK